MSDAQLHEFEDRASLDTALAERVVTTLERGLTDRGSASLVVSGGSTPRGLFTQLAAHALDWSRVTVTLADERWVAADHADSNERLVHECLLQDKASSARFVSLVTTDQHAEAAEAEIARRLSAFDRFDVVLLGMGEDGHTASLFPGSEALSRGLDPHNPLPCIAVTPHHAPHQRMSLTLRRLCDTQDLILHVTGAAKHRVLTEAMNRADPLQLPVAAVLQASRPVDIFYAP